MRRLYAGLRRDVVQMRLVYCIWLGQVFVYCIRRDGHRRAMWRTPMIRRSILTVLLCFLTRLAGHACSPRPSCFYLFGDGMWARVRANTPLYLGYEAADRPHPALVV